MEHDDIPRRFKIASPSNGMEIIGGCCTSAAGWDDNGLEEYSTYPSSEAELIGGKYGNARSKCHANSLAAPSYSEVVGDQLR